MIFMLLLRAVPTLRIAADFLFVFIYFYLSHVFVEKRVGYSWCRLIDEPTNRRVSRMMVKSSRVAMTRIPAVEALR
jgi:hypothetical protein